VQDKALGDAQVLYNGTCSRAQASKSTERGMEFCLRPSGRQAGRQAGGPASSIPGSQTSMKKCTLKRIGHGLPDPRQPLSLVAAAGQVISAVGADAGADALGALHAADPSLHDCL